MRVARGVSILVRPGVRAGVRASSAPGPTVTASYFDASDDWVLEFTVTTGPYQIAGYLDEALTTLAGPVTEASGSPHTFTGDGPPGVDLWVVITDANELSGPVFFYDSSLEPTP